MRRSVVIAGEGEDGGLGRDARRRDDGVSCAKRPAAPAPSASWSSTTVPCSGAAWAARSGSTAASSCVGEADGGEAALDAIERLRPDVVLLDLRMPDIDGLEVLDRLRDLDPPPQCKVLIVSASLDEHVEQAARAAGAAGCVSKDLARADICATALRVARQ